ncbi:MAG: MoaD/ThiS family protein [Chloroflexi bacterium]|nr:MoaD/ThiS family protein [Chloroflexota bacterium]
MTTQVNLKFTGHVRTRMGMDRMEFDFKGNKLNDLLQTLFAQHDLQDLILDENGDVQAWSRVVINGRFSYLVGDMDAPIQDGDMIVLIRPYAVAF